MKPNSPEAIAYRTRAEQLTGGRTQPYAAVYEDADRTGAFVEVVVWVPKEEIRGTETECCTGGPEETHPDTPSADARGARPEQD